MASDLRDGAFLLLRIREEEKYGPAWEENVAVSEQRLASSSQAGKVQDLWSQVRSKETVPPRAFTDAIASITISTIVGEISAAVILLILFTQGRSDSSLARSHR